MGCCSSLPTIPEQNQIEKVQKDFDLKRLDKKQFLELGSIQKELSNDQIKKQQKDHTKKNNNQEYFNKKYKFTLDQGKNLIILENNYVYEGENGMFLPLQNKIYLDLRPQNILNLNYKLSIGTDCFCCMKLPPMFYGILAAEENLKWIVFSNLYGEESFILALDGHAKLVDQKLPEILNKLANLGYSPEKFKLTINPAMQAVQFGQVKYHDTKNIIKIQEQMNGNKIM